MAQPQMPHIPGAAVMNDTLDFVKNLWGSMGVPGLTAPTLSVDDLDKKINDLKAVEAWLNLNMNMLRGSIQALEVQRGTIATLQSVGSSLAAAVNQSATAASTKPTPAQGGEHKSIFDVNPYTAAFFQHARATAPQAAEPAAAAAAAPPPASAAKSSPAPAQAQTSGNSGNPGDSGNTAASAPGQADAAPAASTVWWNLLQEQFKQAVSTAVASESMMADAAARATETAAKFAAATAKPATPAAAPAAGVAGADRADRADRAAGGDAADGGRGSSSTGAAPAATDDGVKKPATRRAPAKAAKPPGDDK